jgi:hypothetical protein
VLVCWAKVGKAKLIANPTRATATDVFIMLRVCRFRLILKEFILLTVLARAFGTILVARSGCYLLLGVVVGDGVAAAVAGGAGVTFQVRSLSFKIPSSRTSIADQ